MSVIRPVEAPDLPELARLFDQYRRFYGHAADVEGALHYLEERIANGESVILVADGGGGTLAGFCQLYPTFCSVAARPIYVLYDLFVEGPARRQGVARALMEAARARAVADGKARMDLSTAKDNVKAQALYESLGWKRDEVFYSYSLELDD
jgi:ribosomal protein S18 acetylase RimI-like enzyme